MRLELRGVGKSFGKQQALAGVDLVVEHGERVALVGPNGSGKSTLLRVVMGLLTCDGVVMLDGVSPFEHRSKIAHRLAYVPQVAPQLGATVGEVIRSVVTLRGLDPARVESWADRLGLVMPEIRDKAFRALSGGMKQKMLIALAFSAGASLLILDEPTASLDAVARDKFVDMLDEVAADATVILCSHRLDEVQKLVSRVIELGEGRVVRSLSAIDGGATNGGSGHRAGGQRD